MLRLPFTLAWYCIFKEMYWSKCCKVYGAPVYLVCVPGRPPSVRRSIARRPSVRYPINSFIHPPSLDRPGPSRSDINKDGEPDSDSYFWSVSMSTACDLLDNILGNLRQSTAALPYRKHSLGRPVHTLQDSQIAGFDFSLARPVFVGAMCSIIDRYIADLLTL